MTANDSYVVITGCFTDEPIYRSYLQKSCQECEKPEEINIKPLLPKHHKRGKFYKNVIRNTSSNSMDLDLAFEAFNKCREMYGIVYLEYVADGDTYLKTVLERVEYGNIIRRVPCANHAKKNYRSQKENVAIEKARNETALELNQAKRTSMSGGSRCAIKKRKGE